MSIIGLIIVLLFNVYFAANFKNDIKFLKSLMTICIIQNIVVLFFSSALSRIDYNIIIASKEFWLYFYIIFRHPKNNFRRSDELICIVSIAILILYLILGSATGNQSFQAAIVSYRQLSLPFLFYLLGKKVWIKNEKDIRNLLSHFKLLMFLTCVFGFVELAYGEAFWEMLGISDYTQLKNGIMQIINGHYSYGGLYTYDFYPILGKMIRRMGSLLVDAVILGQLLSVAVIVELFIGKRLSNKKNHVVLLLLFSASLVFTFAKGGYIIAALTTGLLLRKQKNHKILGYVSILLMIVGVCILILYSIQNELSTVSHVNGLLDGIKGIIHHPFGTGLGSAGNLAQEYGNKDIMTSGESFVGALLGQIGIIGIIIYFVFFYEVLKKRTKTYYLTVFRNITISLLATSFVNNTAISFTSCFIIFIMMGALIKYNNSIGVKSQVVVSKTTGKY